jgi:hypothetical protein
MNHKVNLGDDASDFDGIPLSETGWNMINSL